MRSVKPFAIWVLAIAVVSLPGLARAADEGVKDKARSLARETKSQVSDSWLTAKAKIALLADERVKSTQISVETQNGVVALRGKVDSAEAKAAAGDIAKGIEGAKDVKNELRVVAPEERKAVTATDKDITRHVQDRLASDARLKNAKIDVRADAGVVVLTGHVPNIATSARASELARAVPGVRAVKNDLVYESRSSSAAPTAGTR
jgi:hyperosmotically inducible protein